MSRCRLLIVDDSPTISRALAHGLARMPDIEVVGTAADAYEAREKIKALNPDVITLDVEMPRMSGLDFLERIMRLRPIPVVMFSSIAPAGSRAAVQALSLGAVDVVVKPDAGLTETVIQDLAIRIKSAAGSRVGAQASQIRSSGPKALSKAATMRRWNGRIVLIGASTGGVGAIETVLDGLPADCPPTVIAQHMPESFLLSFVSRLNDRNPQSIGLAEEGMPLERGTVLVAPGGDQHTGVTASADGFSCVSIKGGKTNGHIPSVDELFFSAREFASQTVGVILTGLGRDGAEGLRCLRDNGSLTIGQSAESCVVYGMPRAAAELGAVQSVQPLAKISSEICRLCETNNAMS